MAGNRAGAMNHLYYGDNLGVLRESIADASVDLIYLDPPFNSNASYNVLFKGPAGKDSAAQIEAFDDSWHWTDAAEDAFQQVRRGPNAAAATMLTAMRTFLGENDMMAYLAMMAVRLLELHRVLKPTGSLYLHCDPTASHYLKILLDAVFGASWYRAEIVWKRTNARGTPRNWPHLHDTIFHYADPKSSHSIPKVKADKAKMPHTLITGPDGKKYQTYELTGAGVTKDGESGKPWRGFDVTALGRHWGNSHSQLDAWANEGLIHFPPNNGFPRRRDAQPFDADSRMVTVGDVWTDIDRLNQTAKERLGYPTQKPVALLERIIAASSNPDDVVLDPFCGCGTTVHAAEKLGRQWIGIDVTHLAIGLIEKRLRDAFPAVAFTTHGVPQDLAGARDLARRGRDDPNYYFEFEKWALSLIAAQPGNLSKKGADRGIDGNIWFGKTGRAIVSVKAGDTVGVSMIRDLRGTIEREGAEIGILLSLTPPKKTMIAEAAAAGQHELDGFAPVPRLQIVTVEDALALRDRAVQLPARRDDAFKRAAKEDDPGAQGSLGL
jgi:site-specific DNA-methyltransferase (adenine-specific)